MTRRLSGLYRNALVTGASAGLGRAFAEMLLADGVPVWGTARDVRRLASVKIGEGEASSSRLFNPVQLDLANPQAAVSAFRRAADEAGGGFDLVVANAGYGAFGEFVATDFEIWETQIEAMLVTTVRLSHASLRLMRARERGTLVHVSSLAVDFPIPFMAAYNVTKAGLSALSESLFVETRGTGVTVLDFRPGDYRTSFNHTMQSVTPVDASAEAPTARVWRTLEANLNAAPPAARAAADLRRALLRGRSGVVRSGSFFQASLAPFLARLAPACLRRRAMARYFGLT